MHSGSIPPRTTTERPALPAWRAGLPMLLALLVLLASFAVQPARAADGFGAGDVGEALPPGIAKAPPSQVRQVLLLNSYHPGYNWNAALLEGMHSILDKADLQLHIRYEFMDTKHDRSDALTDELRSLYRRKYRNNRFDVIIASDNDAFEFLRRFRDELFPGAPVVFCGVNGFRERMLDGIPNFTGIAEDFDLLGTMRLALQLHPGTKNMVVVGGVDTSSAMNYRLFQDIRPQFAGQVNFIDLYGLNVPDLVRELKQVPRDSVVLYLPYYLTPDGTRLTVSDSISLIYRTADLPMYTPWAHLLSDGMVGGRMVSPYDQGRTAAEIAMRVLHGANAGDLPVRRDAPNPPTFDYEMLQHFGIPEFRLPDGAVIRNEPQTLLHRHKGLVGAVVLFIAYQSVVIAWLWRSNRQSRKAAAVLRREEERLSALLDLSKMEDRPTPELMRFVLRKAVDLCRARTGTLLLHAPGASPAADHFASWNGSYVRHAGPDDGPLDLDAVLPGWRQLLERGEPRRRGLLPPRPAEPMPDLGLPPAPDTAEYPPAYRDGYAMAPGGDGDEDREAAAQGVSASQPGTAPGTAQEGNAPALWPGESPVRPPHALVPVRHGEGLQLLFMVAGDIPFDDTDVRHLTLLGRGLLRHLQHRQEERQRQQLEEQLLHAQKLEAIGTFAGGIAHDFNNILEAVGCCCELALEDLPERHPVSTDLEQALRSTRRGKSLVRQLLAFSRKEPRRQHDIRLPEIMEECVSMVGALLPHTIDVTLSVAGAPNMEPDGGPTARPTASGAHPDLSESEPCRPVVLRKEGFPPPVVRGDPTQVLQVVVNLCTNAEQAMRGTGGALRLELDGTCLREGDHPGLPPGLYARITVSDTGRGMTPEVIARIFDPFFTTRPHGEGTGLGLAVAHGIIRQHGGVIEVDSVPMRGSTFTVLLPAAHQFAPTASAGAPLAPRPPDGGTAEPAAAPRHRALLPDTGPPRGRTQPVPSAVPSAVSPVSATDDAGGTLPPAVAAAPAPRTGIPAAPPVAQAGQIAAAAFDASPDALVERLLVVDDDPGVLASLDRLFTRLGYEVHAAPNADAARALLDELPAVSLLLTDQDMPGMTGLQLAAMVHQASPDLPVVLITGLPEDAPELAPAILRASGIARLLPKPLDHARLVRVVRMLIDGAPTASSRRS